MWTKLEKAVKFVSWEYFRSILASGETNNGGFSTTCWEHKVDVESSSSVSSVIIFFTGVRTILSFFCIHGYFSSILSTVRPLERKAKKCHTIFSAVSFDLTSCNKTASSNMQSYSAKHLIFLTSDSKSIKTLSLSWISAKFSKSISLSRIKK